MSESLFGKQQAASPFFRGGTAISEPFRDFDRRREAREVVWVLGEVFGRPVPIWLQPHQIEHADGGSRP
jgi:hypothetical protein